MSASNADDGQRELIAAYGQLADDAVGEQIIEHIVTVMNFLGFDARRSRSGSLTTMPTIALPLPSGDYQIEVAGLEDPIALPQVAAMRQAAAGRPVRSVLLSMSGFSADTLDSAVDDAASVILLDRSHFEAILCGLLAPDDLFARVARRARFDAQPYTSLTTLLLETNNKTPPQCVPPDRLPPPWSLLKTVEPEVQTRHLLTGAGKWPDVSGAAVLNEQHLLVTTADGLLKIHLTRGTTTWLLPLRGCRGAPLPQANGTLLTLCNNAVVKWQDSQLSPLAGGFSDAICLFSGPAGEPWLLSGIGPTNSASLSTLALTRLGPRPGQQQSYRISFDANVVGAAWLSDRKFYLAAAGGGAVVDLARGGAVQIVDRIPLSQAYPNHVVATDEDTVLTASTDGQGIGASIFQTNPARQSSTQVAGFTLNGVQAMAVDSGRRVYLVGDVRGNDVHVPHPVVIRVTLAPKVAGQSTGVHPGKSNDSSRASDAYYAVRLAAHGFRKDYALEPAPIATGGQATVTSARHKATGIPVAFKRLTSRSEEHIARMRREIEASQLFGGNAHVVPVLDFSPSHDWYVMPLASDTAEDALEELQRPEQLRNFVIAICNGLRRPHKEGWIHRDLKPANILRLNGHWAVADWGLGRRPRGHTSNPGRTQIGGAYGTEGFAAPELSTDAHEAGPQADIYSIGQIIGWVQTSKWPQANRPRLPDSGPWRAIVEAATHDDPTQRPADVDGLLKLMTNALSDSATPPRVTTESGQRSHSFEQNQQNTSAPDTTRASTAAPNVEPSIENPITIKGILGSISFDGQAVTITKNKKGFGGKRTHTLLIGQISGITTKPASHLFHGYIQINAPGHVPASELRGGLASGRPPAEDPNSLSFPHRANNAINELQKRIETTIATRSNS